MFSHEVIQSFNQLEMSVYNYIVRNEDKVIYMKVRELADAAHVSTTTVLRFCKKAGCEGYAEFRLKLKQEVQDSHKMKMDMDITSMTDFFQRVQTKGVREGLAAAVEILLNASPIIFIGVGNSSFIGKYGARYFNNVGCLAFAIDDPFTPVFRGKNEKMAAIALSVSGETRETITLAQQLRRRGSSLISITNKADCSLAKMSDCNINYYIPVYHSAKGDYDLTSQMAAVFLIELLGRQIRGEAKATGMLWD